MDPFVGEIRLFAGKYAPKNWLLCEGQIIPIRQYSALFSVLDTQYGGDGKSNFALPDLRGRISLHQGEGPGLTSRGIGEKGGASSIQLDADQMPAHNHVPACHSAQGDGDPTNAVWTNTVGLSGAKIYGPTPEVDMSPSALGAVGGGQAHNNNQPYVALNYIICFDGIYPPRT
jgi:microcystin-dependent protein